MKLKGATDQDGVRTTLLFWCPGCKTPHPYRVERSKTEGPEHPVWTFNGDMERPTFTPSLLVNANSPGHTRCHLFMTAGQLQFCGDSQHELAGKTVECPDWDEEKW